MTGHRSEPQLCLQFVSLGDASASINRLSIALQAAPFSSVIVSGQAGAPAKASLARPLIELIQSKNFAALVVGDPGTARELGADGVHVAWSPDLHTAYAQVREALGARFIVGADAGRSRHDAMTLAEAGADYIGFGIPPHVEDRVTAASRRLDLTAWWAEIFEVPVIALDVETAHDVSLLSAANADFIGFSLSHGLSGPECEAHVRSMASARSNIAPVSHATA